MERNEACPQILLARLHLFIYLFPTIFFSFFLSSSVYLGGLGIVSSNVFHVLSDTWRVALSPSPCLTLYLFLSHTFSKGTLFIVPGEHYIMH